MESSLAGRALDQASLFLFVTLSLIWYLVWAVVLSESLFHRVWSLALFLLLLSTTLIYSLPLSGYTILLSVFAVLDGLLCVALSPAQAVFHQTKNGDQNDRALEIFPSKSINDGAPPMTILAESVLSLHCIGSLMD
jgi:hypothetical protein